MRWFKAMKWFKGRRRTATRSPRVFGRVIPASEALEERRLLSSTILFNPTGTAATPTETIGGLDEAPGNALAVDALPLAVGKTFQLDYQATVAALLSPTGVEFSPPGLNSTYQLTAVASFTEVVESLTPSGGVATFALAPTQAPNSFFELYYNPAVIANNLAGTGFNSGTLILSGKPDPTVTNSGNFALALDASGNPVIQPLNQFDTANNPGELTVTGAGSALNSADATSIDPAFFVTPVTQLAFNTSTTVPFETTDPSSLFVSQPGGVPPTLVPNRGAINGVSGPDFQFQADANNSFTAAAPAINIVKATNGQVALTPPGPVVAVGSTVTWTYDVTNPGNEPLKNVVVTDDNGTPSDPADDFHPTPVLAGGFNVGDTNHNGLLDPGEDWKYTATGTAAAGQYENRVVTTGVGNLSNITVTSNSISHYFAAAPAINIVKATNGQVALTPPGPVVAVGSTVTWTYDVTNPGNEPLKNVVVTDDNGTPSDPADDFHPTPVLAGGFNVGDTNHNGLLDPGEDWKYTATGTAAAGQYENRVVTTGVGNLSNITVTANSISHYFAAAPAINIVKLVNGQLARPARPDGRGRQHRDLHLRRHQPGQRPAVQRDAHRRQRHALQPRRRLPPHPRAGQRVQRGGHQPRRPARPGRGLGVHGDFDRRHGPVHQRRHRHRHQPDRHAGHGRGRRQLHRCVPDGHERPTIRRPPSAQPDRRDLLRSPDPGAGREPRRLSPVRARPRWAIQSRNRPHLRRV